MTRCTQAQQPSPVKSPTRTTSPSTDARSRSSSIRTRSRCSAPTTSAAPSKPLGIRRTSPTNPASSPSARSSSGGGSQQSWHHGAGQAWLDWPGSDRNRFRTSKGIDLWTQKQIGLLHSTTHTFTTSNVGLRILKAGTRVYLADGNNLKYSVDATSFSTVTGTPTVKCESIATDGFDVWAAYGASGLYQTNSGSAAASSYVTGSVDLVGYVKGRLMCAAGPSLFNVTAAGALPDALFTHSASAWVWSGFANAPGFIYAAGYAGGHSEIYSVTIADTVRLLIRRRSQRNSPKVKWSGRSSGTPGS
jgi:hypothetical protein